MAKHLTEKQRQQRIEDVERIKSSGHSTKEACEELGFSAQTYYADRRSLDKMVVPHNGHDKKPRSERLLVGEEPLRESILDAVFKKGTRAMYDALADRTW